MRQTLALMPFLQMIPRIINRANARVVRAGLTDRPSSTVQPRGSPAILMVYASIA